MISSLLLNSGSKLLSILTLSEGLCWEHIDHPCQSRLEEEPKHVVAGWAAECIHIDGEKSLEVNSDGQDWDTKGEEESVVEQETLAICEAALREHYDGVLAGLETGIDRFVDGISVILD